MGRDGQGSQIANRVGPAVELMANNRPSNELVWALANVDRATIRRARLLVWRGTAAEDPQTARVAMALAHKAERNGGGAGSVFLLVICALVAFAWCIAPDGPFPTELGRLLDGVLCAYLVASVAWQQRLAHVTAPRAEMANRAVLRAAGDPYEPTPESARITLAPVGLIVVFLVSFVALSIPTGVLVASLEHLRPLTLDTILVRGVPVALFPSIGIALGSRRAWKPRRADRRPTFVRRRA